MTEEYIVRIVRNLENDDYDCITMGELIRCRDCKHHKGYNCDRLYGMQDAFMARDNDYCSRAERKDNDSD